MVCVCIHCTDAVMVKIHTAECRNATTAVTAYNDDVSGIGIRYIRIVPQLSNDDGQRTPGPEPYFSSLFYDSYCMYPVKDSSW